MLGCLPPTLPEVARMILFWPETFLFRSLRSKMLSWIILRHRCRGKWFIDKQVKTNVVMTSSCLMQKIAKILNTTRTTLLPRYWNQLVNSETAIDVKAVRIYEKYLGPQSSMRKERKWKEARLNEIVSLADSKSRAPSTWRNVWALELVGKRGSNTLCKASIHRRDERSWMLQLTTLAAWGYRLKELQYWDCRAWLYASYQFTQKSLYSSASIMQD